jgi:hypothetical protein
MMQVSASQEAALTRLETAMGERWRTVTLGADIEGNVIIYVDVVDVAILRPNGSISQDWQHPALTEAEVRAAEQ